VWWKGARLDDSKGYGDGVSQESLIARDLDSSSRVGTRLSRCDVDLEESLWWGVGVVA
jgi:hypothetical protein